MSYCKDDAAKKSSQLSIKCECGNEIVEQLQKNKEMGKKRFVPSVAVSIAFAIIIVLLVCTVQSKHTITELDSRVDKVDTSTESVDTTSTQTANVVKIISIESVLNFSKIGEKVEEETNIELDSEQTSSTSPKTKEQNIENKVERKIPLNRGSFLRTTKDDESDNKPAFDKSVFEKLYSQSKTKSVEEIVDQSVNQESTDDENIVDQVRRGRSHFKSRSNDNEPELDPASGRTSEEILNEIVNFGLDQSRYLFDVQEKRIYDNGLSLKKSDPGHFVGVFNKQSQRAKDLSKYGYATLQASSLLSKQ